MIVTLLTDYGHQDDFVGVCHGVIRSIHPDLQIIDIAWERCVGVDMVVDISRSPHRLEPVSATFHGRDLFAQLAAGAELADAGGDQPRRRRHRARTAPRRRSPSAPAMTGTTDVHCQGRARRLRSPA